MNLNDLIKAMSGMKADEIAKIVLKAAGPKAARDIADLWNDPDNNTLSETEITMGPVDNASGSGVQSMIEEFSNPAAQRSLSLAYEQLASKIDGMAESMKGANAALSALLAKAEKEDDDEEDEAAKSAAKSILKELNRLAKSIKPVSAVEKSLRLALKKAQEDGDKETEEEARKALAALTSKAEDMHLEDKDTNQADKPAEEPAAKAEDDKDGKKDEEKEAMQKSVSMLTKQLDDLKNRLDARPVTENRPGELSVREGSALLGSGEEIISKANAAFIANEIDGHVMDEIEHLAQMKFHVDAGVISKNIFEQSVNNASVGAQRFFE